MPAAGFPYLTQNKWNPVLLKFKLPYLGGEVSSEWRTQATEKVFWAYFLGWVQLGPYGP